MPNDWTATGDGGRERSTSVALLQRISGVLSAPQSYSSSYSYSSSILACRCGCSERSVQAAPLSRSFSGLRTATLPMEPSTLPQRGEGAEAAEIESILCPSAPLPLCGKPNILKLAIPEMSFTNRSMLATKRSDRGGERERFPLSPTTPTIHPLAAIPSPDRETPAPPDHPPPWPTPSPKESSAAA